MSDKVEMIGGVEKVKAGQKRVSIKTVAGVYFGGYLLALIISWGLLGFDPGLIMLAHAFPYGSMVFLIPESQNIWYLDYAVYIPIFIAAFIWRKKSYFITILAIYIIILCINITGCVCVLNSLKNIW